MRKASIKETGEEISQAEWERFDAAVARAKAERSMAERAEAAQAELDLFREERAFVPMPAFECGRSREGLPIRAPGRSAAFR